MANVFNNKHFAHKKTFLNCNYRTVFFPYFMVHLSSLMLIATKKSYPSGALMMLMTFHSQLSQLGIPAWYTQQEVPFS